MECLDEMVTNLWQGKGISIDAMLEKINTMTEEIIENTVLMKKNGIEFPVNFIRDALENMQKAIEQKDDYKLADCLYYEWREIAVVYQEIMLEMGAKDESFV